MTRLMDTMLSGTDAWSREARRVWEEAVRLGLALDEAELALLDVHDLQVLRASRDDQYNTPTGSRWTALRGLRALVPARRPSSLARHELRALAWRHVRRDLDLVAVGGFERPAQGL
jgi:hypothetical protein